MEPFLGELRVFSFGNIPKGWATCAGQILPISQNTALFSLLGTTYGGNGIQTFGLPDLRSRVPIGMGRYIDGTTYVLGEMAGTENVTLLQTTMPVHTHLMNGQTTAAGSNLAASPPRIVASPVKAGSADVIYAYTNAITGLNPLFPQSLSTAGGNSPHANMPPFLTVSICIATSGIFPTRN